MEGVIVERVVGFGLGVVKIGILDFIEVGVVIGLFRVVLVVVVMFLVLVGFVVLVIGILVVLLVVLDGRGVIGVLMGMLELMIVLDFFGGGFRVLDGILVLFGG